MDRIQSALDLLRLGKARLAADIALECLRDDPDDAQALAVLCRAQTALGDRSAVATGRRCVALAPFADASHEALALAYKAQLEPMRARSCLEAGIEAVPDSVVLRVQLSALMLGLDNPRRALELADEAIALDPEFVHAHGARAHALLELGETAQAAASLGKAQEIDPEHPVLLRLRARIEVVRGDIVAALETFRAALRRSPHDDEARAGLLLAMRARSRWFRALLWLRQRSELLARRHPAAAVVILIAISIAFTTQGKTGRHLLPIAMLMLFVPEQLANLRFLMHPVDRLLLDRTEIAAALLGPAIFVTAAVVFARSRTELASNVAFAGLALAIAPHVQRSLRGYWRTATRRQRLGLLAPLLLFAGALGVGWLIRWLNS